MAFLRWHIRVFVALLLAGLSGCAGVTALKRIGDIDRARTYPYVQVFPNDEFFPECNIDFCAVLFSEGGAGLYVPRVESLGPGRPADYNLRYLQAYQVSDGSVLFAPLGTAPTEYRTESGQIRIQFGFMPGREPTPRAPFFGFGVF